MRVTQRGPGSKENAPHPWFGRRMNTEGCPHQMHLPQGHLLSHGGEESREGHVGVDGPAESHSHCESRGKSFSGGVSGVHRWGREGLRSGWSRAVSSGVILRAVPCRADRHSILL